jgi:hypothetical protein
MFEIYLQDQMEGWVDQFVVLSDASDQISDNTNLGFTKRILSEGSKLCLGRPFRIVIFNVSFICTIIHKMLRGVVPESIKEGVRVFGEDRAELLEELRTLIDEEVIPSEIGGGNPACDFDAVSNKSDKMNTDKTNDLSLA